MPTAADYFKSLRANIFALPILLKRLLARSEVLKAPSSRMMTAPLL